MKRLIKLLVVHCSDTLDTMDIGAKTIKEWHVKDNGWKNIGYHYVIKRDGTVEQGRPEIEIGSHVYGHNKNSIGICLIGGRSKNEELKDIKLFTPSQLKSLKNLLSKLYSKYNKPKIVGHCDLNNNKTCPNFNVAEWLKSISFYGESNE